MGCESVAVWAAPGLLRADAETCASFTGVDPEAEFCAGAGVATDCGAAELLCVKLCSFLRIAPPCGVYQSPPKTACKNAAAMAKMRVLFIRDTPSVPLGSSSISSREPKLGAATLDTSSDPASSPAASSTDGSSCAIGSCA